ncbi:Ubiquinone biosynthesis O-methyltransferase [subsurface metagenome]
MFKEIPETPYAMRKRIQFIYGEIEKRIRNVEDRAKIRILDIGCGTGEYITIPLGRLGATITGIDTHQPSIEHARQRNPYENVHFQCVSVDELSDQQFDFVICSEVLEHLGEPAKMLESMKKLLKPGGVCIITIPNGYGPKEIDVKLHRILSSLGVLSLLRHLVRKPRQKPDREANWKDSLNPDSPHVQFFSYGRFKHLVEGVGLSILKRRNRRFLSGPFANRLLLKSERLMDWNARIADKLPRCLVSSWMFVIEQAEGKS